MFRTVGGREPDSPFRAEHAIFEPIFRFLQGLL